MYTSQCEGAGDEVGVLGQNGVLHVCVRTYREDPGMSLGSSRQHGGLRVRDNQGGSQNVLGILRTAECGWTTRDDPGMSSKTGKDVQVDPRMSFKQSRSSQDRKGKVEDWT